MHIKDSAKYFFIPLLAILLFSFNYCKKEKSLSMEEKLSKEKLTIEQFAAVKKEVIDLGMAKYYDIFLQKGHPAMSKFIKQFGKDVDEILKKNNINREYFFRFGDDYDTKIKEYLTTHNLVNWNATPEQRQLNSILKEVLIKKK